MAPPSVVYSAENQAREEADVFFLAAAERIGGIVIDQDQQVVAH